MSQVTLNGIEVKFPFKPYPLQIGYMGQLIRSAKNRKNALLESPTGTGKTLSILCSSLAWLNSEIGAKLKAREEAYEARMKSDDFEDNDDNMFIGEDEEEREHLPKIYFSSRTHSQLSQSIKELKKSNPDKNTAVVIGGRDVMCLNEDVKKLDNIGAKNQACKSKIGANCSCRFYNDYEKKIRNTRDYNQNPVLDVEDLVNFGQKHSICPYFASKYLQKKANVVFLPYNYLLDPKIRKAQRIQFNDDVIIFDEGHNIEKTCEDSISIDLRSDSVAICIREMSTIYQFHQQSLENISTLDLATIDAVKEFSPEDMIFLKQIFHQFEQLTDDLVSSFVESNKVKGDLCPDDWIFDVLKKCNLNSENTKQVVEICDKIQAFLVCLLPVKGPAATVASSSLNSFKDFISLLFPDETEDEESFKLQFKQKFKVYLEIIEEEDTKPQANQQYTNRRPGSVSNWLKKDSHSQSSIVRKWILHIWCLSPSVGLKSLTKTNVRSVVLTSGTLAPLDSFEFEFDTKFECKIQNPHIIQRSQMAIYPVSESYSRVRLDSTFANKNNIEYYRALGETLIEIYKNVPDGVLVFFQSYSVMYNSIRKWKDNEPAWKIWSRLNSLKTVFEEKRSKEEFADDIIKFRDSIDRYGRGASFFAICRGKLSEGIDLGNHFSRAVVLVGLPFPSTQDPRVKLKKSYLDQSKNKNFTGQDWYMLQMKRALNQAVGRAIRHKDDYGCVFLLDYRYESKTNDLSKWCRNFVRTPSSYQDMMSEVKKFFEDNRKNELIRKRVEASSSRLVKKELNEEEENDNDANGDVELDFSLSEYTGKNKKRQGKKRAIYESSLDEKNKKSKLPTENVNNLFDIFEPTNEIINDRPKKERRHIEIEYENNANGSNLKDDVILLNDD